MRAPSYFEHIGSHVQDTPRSAVLIGSVINTVFSGSDVKWYYNEKTETYQYWSGSGRPSNPDYNLIGSYSEENSESSSGSNGGISHNILGR